MIAKLHIEIVVKNGITCLKQSYCTPPFKVVNITEDKSSPQLQLMLMNSSPGILDEDDYEQKIELSEPNTYLSDEVEIITVLNSTNYLIIK